MIDPDYLRDSWVEKDGMSYNEITSILEGMKDGCEEIDKEIREACEETCSKKYGKNNKLYKKCIEKCDYDCHHYIGCDIEEWDCNCEEVD